MILVKLGGSLLTNKGGRGAPRFRAAVARRLAKELAGVRPLVVAIGAGSWGHPLALRHRIGHVRLAGRRLQAAVTETQASVATLRAKVAAALRHAGLPVVEIPASSVAVTRRGATAFDAAMFRFYCDRGLVPLTGGDVILDDRMGARVISGDEILSILAKELRATRVVFASDVEGVLRGGKRVGRLTAWQARGFQTKKTGDATGGMGGKLAEAAAIAGAGVPVLVTNGRVPGRLRDACRGKSAAATVIVG